MMNPVKTEPRLVLKRLISAPRERVFEAWIDPEQFAAWWGPYEFTAPVVELDARPGGKINVHMQGPNGSPWEKPYLMGGEFCMNESGWTEQMKNIENYLTKRLP